MNSHLLTSSRKPAIWCSVCPLVFRETSLEATFPFPDLSVEEHVSACHGMCSISTIRFNLSGVYPRETLYDTLYELIEDCCDGKLDRTCVIQDAN